MNRNLKQTNRQQLSKTGLAYRDILSDYKNAHRINNDQGSGILEQFSRGKGRGEWVKGFMSQGRIFVRVATL